MKNNPRFSIITVCYNAENVLEKTIKSVFNQSCKDYEYIVVDGKSRDSTVDIIRKYEDKLTKWISEEDSGIYNAMNKGANMANGEYLFFLNAGDVFYSQDVLSIMKNRIKGSDTAMVYGKIAVVSRNGEVLKIRRRTLSPINIRLGQKVSQQSVFIRKKDFEKLGGLDERYPIASDFDLLCKVIDSGLKYYYVDEIISNYDNSGISSDLRKSYHDTSRVIFERYGAFPLLVYKIKSGFILSLVSIIPTIK